MRRESGSFRKRYFGRLLLGVAITILTVAPVGAQTFSSGSTGVDGAFNPTCTPTPCSVTVTLPPNGIFNFTTVNIPAGVTVTFQKNAANTPVTMLATGGVVIAGTILLDGQPGGDGIAGVFTGGSRGGQGGPGGFDGGTGATSFISTTGSKGLGPGGGGPGAVNQFGGKCAGAGGGYGTDGAGGGPCSNIVIVAGPAYGSPALLPLIGGSGGGGASGNTNLTAGAGGGGGGAILITSSTRIELTGSILARGGRGGNQIFFSSANSASAGGAGSGGAVRLVANSLEGSGGQILVGGGAPGLGGAGGGQGRIRLEAFDRTLVASFSVSPSLAKPGAVFLTNPPALQIASVGGLTPPASPTANFSNPDIILPATAVNPVTVSLTASQIPLGTPVQVSVIPFNGAATGATSPGLSGTAASSTASVNVTIPTDQPVVLSATATFTVLAKAGQPPIMVAGEHVKAIRVAATYGGGSTVTYITASGREVPMR